MAEYREQAKVRMLETPVNRVAAIVIIGIWVGLAILAIVIVSKIFIAQWELVCQEISLTGFSQYRNSN